MTKVRGAKITGAKIKHEFTFLSVPGLMALFDPSKNTKISTGVSVKQWSDSFAGIKVLNSSNELNQPELLDGDGGFKILRFQGNRRLASSDNRSVFNFLHSGNKIAVFSVIKPLIGSDNQQNVIFGTTTNNSASIGFHLTLDDRDSQSRNNIIISGIMNGSGTAFASRQFTPAPNSLTDLRLIQCCYRGVRTGNDFEVIINKNIPQGNEKAGTPSTANSSAWFSFGNPIAGQPSNHDNYLTIIYDWNDATDSEYESRRLMVENLIYQKFNAILPS